MRQLLLSIALLGLLSMMDAKEARKHIDVIDETSTSVAVKVSENKSISYAEVLARIMNGDTIGWANAVKVKDFTAENFSRMDSIHGSMPEFLPTDATNIFTEKHGVYRFIMGKKGIEKIIVNMVGLFPSDDDPKQRYVLFRLNKHLDITANEEALYFPRQGGEIEFEFIVDNASVSLYLEGDFTNLGKEFYFENDNEPLATDALSILRNSRNMKEERYSVKYKLVVPPTGNYTNREVFACHWTCTWMDCYYGAFNLVVVQEGATPEKRPVYIW